MAKVSRWALFCRAFFIALISAQPSVVGGQTSAEEEAWREATEENTALAYHNFLSLFPAGTYVTEAISALGNLGDPPLTRQMQSMGSRNTSTNESGSSPESNEDSRNSGNTGGGIY